MIKVRVVRGIQTGLPLASGLLALSGIVTACTTPDVADDVDSDDSALTVMNPGTGVFELSWAQGTPTGFTFVAKNSTDEYVRALQQMTFSVPAHFLWTRLYPTEPIPEDLDRLRKLSAKISITYYKDGASYGHTSVKTASWQGDSISNLTCNTTAFVVSRRAQAMRFALEISDTSVNPPATRMLNESSFFEVHVIGGTLPQKTLLFDSDGWSLRTRILEGGNPVRGAELALGYTDWRAATLVDASSIDRQIGTATGHTRLGTVEVPIHGELEYEISYGAAIDDAWQAETPLAANTKSRLLPSVGRTAYEGKLSVPKSAQNLQLYFHVKTFLKVDYSKHIDVKWRKYRDGERLLVREAWDNENGAANDNYDFATEGR